MSVVTALVAAPGGRVAVHVDGAVFCTVSQTFVARRRLAVGREFDDEGLARLRDEADADRALADGYRLLEQRARGRAELRARLRAKGHAEAATDTAIDELTSAGLLDDAEFARRYVADKRALNGWGPLRLRHGLLALGIEPELVEAALATRESDGQAGEFAQALDLLARKGAPHPPMATARRRAYQSLLRRGFSGAVAYAAVQAWASGDREEGT